MPPYIIVDIYYVSLSLTQYYKNEAPSEDQTHKK